MWRRPEAAVAGIWALSLLPFAGTRDLYYEEGRYALAALDMLDHGRWLRPEVLGLGFVDRPPLLLWIVALAVRNAKAGQVQYRTD
ncbi:MAG: glycosyltransferase family 39 protein, partial [Acidobacteria bacterium ACB2]|nr:glycosyltransferase family 39 protein [Acidobacteria bacterium ACB2]